MLSYDLSVIPFSLPGSFLTIMSRPAGSDPNNHHRLLYRTCSQQATTEKYMPFSASDFFEIALVHEGVEIPYSWIAQPHRLDLHSEGEGSATIAFADPHTLVFETIGVTLRLIPCKSFATEYAPATNEICLVDWPARGIHHFRGGGILM